MQAPYLIRKPLRGRFPKSPGKLWAMIAVLSPMFTWCLKPALAQEMILVANGSSVLLSAPYQDRLGVVQWTFSNGTEGHAILDYFSASNDLTIKPLYSERVDFFPSNGSLLLKDVRMEDNGEYKVRIDLRQETVRSTVLKVIVGWLTNALLVANPGLDPWAFLSSNECVTCNITEKLKALGINGEVFPAIKSITIIQRMPSICTEKQLQLSVPVRPLSDPKIRINSSLVRSPAEIVCNVPLGQVDSIEWKKNGAPIAPDSCYQIINSSVLYIKKVKKSDCATFSCNVSNPLYWKESSYNIIFEGTSSMMKNAFWLSVTALVTAIVSLGVLIGLFLLPNKKCITDEHRCFVDMYIQVLVSTSSFLLLIASAIWMGQKGVVASFILLSMFLLIVMALSLLIMVIGPFFPEKLQVCRVMLDSVAPGGGTLIILFSIYLIQDIHMLQGEGCTEVPNRTNFSVVILFVPLILLFLLYLCSWPVKWFYSGKAQREMEGGRPRRDSDSGTKTQQREAEAEEVQVTCLGLCGAEV